MKTIDASPTVRSALTWSIPRLDAAGVESGWLDAQLLLAWALGLRREDLHREPDAILDNRARRIFDKAIELRALRRPLPYITGEQWFYGLPFKVNRAVLIPRPETEMLVDFAIRHASQPQSRIADICTGSGCVAVSIAARLSDALVRATDISDLALHIARKNVARHKVGERVTLLQGDLYEPLQGMTFDVIVANPPYVTDAQYADLMPEVRDYEPALALCGNGPLGVGDDGTAVHGALFAAAGDFLAPGGWIAVEVGQGQAAVVAAQADALGFEEIDVLKDDAGIERVVAARTHPGRPNSVRPGIETPG